MVLSIWTYLIFDALYVTALAVGNDMYIHHGFKHVLTMPCPSISHFCAGDNPCF